MANSWYTPADVPATQSRGTSSTIRSEYAALEAAFDKFPTPAQLWGSNGNYAVAGGSTNAWTASIAATYLVGYVDGMQIRVKFPAANTTTTPTINLNSLGAKVICAEDGDALGVGDIAANMIATLTYTSTSGKFQMVGGTAIADATAAAASASAAAGSASAAASSASAASASASAASSSASSASSSASSAATSAAAAASTISPVSVADYTALRAYAGSAAQITVTGYSVTTAPSGIAGAFTRDDSDTTSSDNGGTIIVASNGKRWKRQFVGAASVKWFGAVGDDSTNDATAISNAAAAHKHIKFEDGTFRLSSNLTLAQTVNLEASQGALIKPDSGITLAIRGQVLAGNYEIFDGDGTVDLDGSASAYNLAWFKTTNGYINERWDFSKRGMTSFSTKSILIPRPRVGQAGVYTNGDRNFWYFSAPLIVADAQNASVWFVDAEFHAQQACDAFMQFDDAAKPENIYFYGPLQAYCPATLVVGVGLDFKAGSRVSFFGQVVMNGFQTSIKLGGTAQTAGVEDIYMPRTQLSFFSVAALDIYGTAAGTVQNVHIGNVRATAAQSAGLPVVRMRGLLRDVTIENVYYATDVPKDGFGANDAADVVLIDSNAEGTIQHCKIGAIYQANADNGLRIQSTAGLTNTSYVTVERIFAKFNGNAINVDRCQYVRVVGIENQSDVTIGSNSAYVEVSGTAIRNVTNNSTSSSINGLGRQNRGAGVAPSAALDWPVGRLIREDGDGRIYIRVANAGAASDFVQMGGPPLQTYTVSNVTTDRSFDADATTLDEVADVLGTLIADLRARGSLL